MIPLRDAPRLHLSTPSAAPSQDAHKAEAKAKTLNTEGQRARGDRP